MRAACGMLIALMAIAGGCAAESSGYRPPYKVEYAKPRKAPVPYAQIVRNYNPRVQSLERLRAPITLVVDSPGETDGRRTDQVEGSFQFMRPSSVALRLDKVGETLAYLGSNDAEYWWIELKDGKRAQVGSHALATPRSAARFGVPVHPLDLIDLMGVLPLPESPKGVRTRWTDDGNEIAVILPARGAGWGERRIYIDPATWRPTRTEILDARAAIVAYAELSRYLQVAVRGEPNSPAMLASRYELVIPIEDTNVTVTVASPENPKERLRLGGFNLQALLDSYGVTDVERIDEPAKEHP